MAQVRCDSINCSVYGLQQSRWKIYIHHEEKRTAKENSTESVSVVGVQFHES